MSAESTSTDMGEWAIATAESEEGNAIFRVRTDYPTDPNIKLYSEGIVIRWEYGSDETGMPDPITREAMDLFEDCTASLQEDGHAYLMLATTGFELREWVYYAKNSDEFMQAFNAALAGKPRFPLQIQFLHDPEWNYWRDVIHDIKAAD